MAPHRRGRAAVRDVTQGPDRSRLARLSSRSSVSLLAVGLLCAGTAILVLLPAAAPLSRASLDPLHGETLSAVRPSANTAPPVNLSLTANDQPSEVCALNTTDCSAAQSATRVLLTAHANQPLAAWPAVQVVFVIETSAYDGVYDPVDAVATEKQQGSGSDKCAQTANQPLCEESNGVPFFEDHALSVAQQIQAANPSTSVSFAMVDYIDSCDLWSDYCDQAYYHVDVPKFSPAIEFADQVTSGLKGNVLGGDYVLHDEDLADNFLHSASISMLYGAMYGLGFDWSNSTHHVIVWMGSTAPRAPGYMENYCSSPSAMLLDNYPACTTSTCEPSTMFPQSRVPECEGWAVSQDGVPNDSVAGYARSAPTCVHSLGGQCTIDAIDLWDTPTDPYSPGWPAHCTANAPSCGPGSPTVLADSLGILSAGCAIAAATGGTWTGPSYFTCPDGQQGTLVYVNHGPVHTPDTSNSRLLQAFGSIGFGPVRDTAVATGGNSPMFQFVPTTNFEVATWLGFTTACTTSVGFWGGCSPIPLIAHQGSAVTFGWNWSSDPTQNILYAGDTWSAAFYVVNMGPPYGEAPVNACLGSACTASGAAPIDGYYTWATYQLPNTTSSVTQTFPEVMVKVVLAPGEPAAVAPPPPPPPPPVGIIVPGPVQLPNPVPVTVPIQATLGTLSLQATATGLLMAGLTRIMLKTRPIAMQMAVKTAGNLQSKFDAAQTAGPEVGRFE